MAVVGRKITEERPPALRPEDLAGLRVSFARDVMMQSINAALSCTSFVGVDLDAAACFAAKAADALITALTKPKGAT